MIERPNHIYVSEYKGENSFGGESHFVIVVAADSRQTAREYIKERIGFDVEPIWLVSNAYPTIYVQDGSKPHGRQVKILSNSNFHTYKK